MSKRQRTSPSRGGLVVAEIESTSKILLGPLGLDRAWEYWRVRAGFPA